MQSVLLRLSSCFHSMPVMKSGMQQNCRLMREFFFLNQHHFSFCARFPPLNTERGHVVIFQRALFWRYMNGRGEGRTPQNDGGLVCPDSPPAQQASDYRDGGREGELQRKSDVESVSENRGGINSLHVNKPRGCWDGVKSRGHRKKCGH